MIVPLVIVLQYIKKTLSQVHLCSIVMQKVRYFMGIWSWCYLFFYIYVPEHVHFCVLEFSLFVLLSFIIELVFFYW